MFRELIRYALTGGLSVALNTIIIIALTEWVGLYYLVSIALCFAIVTVVSFCLNRRWTFGKVGGRVAVDFRRYTAILLANMLISVALSYLLVEHLGVPYELSTAALSLIFMPISFLVHRQWSFALRWSARK